MASITIRDIDDDLEQRLKQRATQQGHSLQAKAHDILEDMLSTEPSAAMPGNLAAAIRAIVEPLGGIELELFPRQPICEPQVFELAAMIVLDTNEQLSKTRGRIGNGALPMMDMNVATDSVVVRLQ